MPRLESIDDLLVDFLLRIDVSSTYWRPTLGSGIDFLLFGVLGILIPSIFLEYSRRDEMPEAIESSLASCRRLFLNIAKFSIILLPISSAVLYAMFNGFLIGYSLFVSAISVFLIGCLLAYFISLIWPVSNAWFSSIKATLFGFIYLVLFNFINASLDRDFRELSFESQGSFRAYFSLSDAFMWINDSINLENLVALVVTVILSTSLIKSLLKAVVSSGFFPILNRCEGSKGIYWNLVIYFSAIPAVSFLDGGLRYSYRTSIISFAYNIDKFVITIWALAVLHILYVKGKDRVELSKDVLMVGVLASSSLIFSIRLELIFPVTFILGVIILKWVIRASNREATSHTLDVYSASSRREIIRDLIRRKNNLTLFRNLRRSLVKKTLEKDFEYSDLEDLSRNYDELTGKEYELGSSSPINLFSIPPLDSAWDNGMYGTKFALIFGLPWILVGIIELFYLRDGGLFYPMWQIAYEATLLILKWLVIGFVFGYFYEYIRGEDGLSKGLWLSFAIIAPSLPVALLTFQNLSDWQSLLFWCLQVFIHCLLIGLIGFEFSRIYRIGYRDWRYIFDIHGLPTIGVSVSSLIAAIGLTTTTLLSSQATEIVTRAIQLAFPELPEIPIPEK